VLGLEEDAVMYINFWYPIGLSKEITADESFCAQVFGLPLVSGADEALPQVSDLSLN